MTQTRRNEKRARQEHAAHEREYGKSAGKGTADAEAPGATDAGEVEGSAEDHEALPGSSDGLFYVATPGPLCAIMSMICITHSCASWSTVYAWIVRELLLFLVVGRAFV